MRLLFVTPYFPPYQVGGAEESTVALAMALQERGHEVRILTLQLGDAQDQLPLSVERIDVGARMDEPGRPLRPKTFERPGLQLRVARAISHAARYADLVHCQTLHLLPAAYLGARRARVPVAATIRDMMGVCSIAVCLLDHDRVPADCSLLKLERECLPRYREVYGVAESLRHTAAVLALYVTARGRSAVLRRCDGVFAVSEEVARLYENAGLIRLGSARQLPNIAANELPPRADGERDIAIYAGKVSPGKGVAYLLEAVALARERAPDLRLVVVGRAEEPWLTRLRAPQVEYRGWIARENLLSLYDRARFAVVPSVWPEPLPRAALEAAAAGVAVVGTRVGGTPEVITHEETGLLVPPRDAPALADAFVRLWHDQELGSALGTGAQERVGATFSAQAVASKAEELYEELIERGR